MRTRECQTQDMSLKDQEVSDSESVRCSKCHTRTRKCQSQDVSLEDQQVSVAGSVSRRKCQSQEVSDAGSVTSAPGSVPPVQGHPFTAAELFSLFSYC